MRPKRSVVEPPPQPVSKPRPTAAATAARNLVRTAVEGRLAGPAAPPRATMRRTVYLRPRLGRLLRLLVEVDAPGRSCHGGGVTVGYSGTPQARKLGLKPGCRISLIAAPDGWQLNDPPPATYITRGPADVVLKFCRTAADVQRGLAALETRIFPAGAIWLAWPRRAAGHVSDVTDEVIRAVVLPRGLVDVKVCAIDDDWSGLKVVWRTERRREGTQAITR